MKKFKITYTQKWQITAEVVANSREEAEDIIKRGMGGGRFNQLDDTQLDVESIDRVEEIKE